MAAADTAGTVNANQIVEALLNEPNPSAKKKLELEYRPYQRGEDWVWAWVLHPEDRQRAVAHGEAKNRAAASTEARLKARRLGGVIAKVTVLGQFQSALKSQR